MSCITLDKRQCGGKSTGLEKLGFVKTMADLKDKDVKVVEVVTDAHMQISSIMSKSNACYTCQNINICFSFETDTL